MLINHRSFSILSPPTKIRARVNFFPSNTPQKHNCDSQQFYSCHTHISFIFIPFARIAIEGAKLSGFSRKMRRDGNKCEAFSLCAHCILYILNVRIYIYFFLFRPLLFPRGNVTAEMIGSHFSYRIFFLYVSRLYPPCICILFRAVCCLSFVCSRIFRFSPPRENSFVRLKNGAKKTPLSFDVFREGRP